MAASLGPLVLSLSCRPFDREIMPNGPALRVAVENKKWDKCAQTSKRERERKK